MALKLAALGGRISVWDIHRENLAKVVSELSATGREPARVLCAMEAQSAEFLHTDLHGLRFDVDTLTREFVAEGRRTMRDIITGLFEKNAAGEHKPRWGDKTPYYVLHIPKLLEWWPDAQIIHIVRDGRDVALSMFARRHDFRAYNTYHVAREWERYVETGSQQGRLLPTSQYLELRYEDMLGDQKSTVQTICAFLGEAYSDDLLAYKKSGEAGKTPLLQQPIQKSNQDKWRHDMTSWQIRVFESGAGDTLRHFGYPLAIIVMIMAAIFPYLYFKWRKWL